ncbi:MAG: hypothetical protein K8U03_05725 [Planctomycetia bacterium]|nr:hypothetical protein [Planctomycetia bacterium]
MESICIKRTFVGVCCVGLLFVAGCQEKEAPIPTIAQDINRAMMEPDSEEKVRRLLELSAKAREIHDLPATRTTLGYAVQSAATIDDPVLRAELQTLAGKELMRGKWEKEGQKAISAARISAATIPDLSKKVSALTSLAIALQQIGDNVSADTSIRDAEKTVVGIAEPELRVPLLAALSAAFVKFGDPVQAEKQLGAALTLAGTIPDSAKRTAAESQAAVACYRNDRPIEGRKFFDAAIATAEKIPDAAAKSTALIGIAETLLPYRKQVPVELPLKTAIDVSNTIASESVKQTIQKRLNAALKTNNP